MPATRDSDTPVLDLLAEMTSDSLDFSCLDEKQIMMARIAALVAVDAPPASYLLNLGAANEVGVSLEEIRGIFAAIAPIVGTTHIVSATGKIARAMGYVIQSFEGDMELAN